MTTNDPKTVKPEELVNAVFNTLFGAAQSTEKPKATAPPADSFTETMRILKRVEEVAKGSVNEPAILLDVAAVHLRILETALSYQK